MAAKIMLIEQDQETFSQRSKLIQKEGYSVLRAEHLDVAFNTAIEKNPQGILCSCDNIEPERIFEFIQQIRDHITLQHNVIILYSAGIDEATARRAMELGADDIIQHAQDWDSVMRSLRSRMQRLLRIQNMLSRRMEELELLRQIDEELSYYMSPDWVISIMIDWALRRTNSKAALMLLRDMRDDTLRIRHINGTWQGKQFGQGDMLDDYSFIDSIMTNQKSRLIDDLRLQSEFVAIGTEMVSMLGIPIVASQNMLGILLLESEREKAFTDEDQRFLEQMANRAAVALEYSNLFERLINQMQAEIELREMFGRFISPEVAGAIQRGELNLSGEIRNVSVLFVDVRDFTLFCDTHQPHEVVDLLNAFLPEVVKASSQHGGIVNKFGGDSALVIFGAPNIVEESAYQAAQVAIKIREAMERISQERTKLGKLPVKVGIGISSGEVIAGAVGPRERQEYTVIGDPVNMAARLQGLTKIYPQYSIFMTQKCYEAMNDHLHRFELATLGGVAISGKADLVSVWSVVGMKN
jgi:class 3 adenylate cyclase/CheY-like chemotaxis protein